MSKWGVRAAQLYDSGYASRYRQHDDHLTESRPSMEIAARLSAVCEACGPGLTALDLGCGTGRYFWALKGVRQLIGLDASAAMLAHARDPYAAERMTIDRVTLVEGDMLTATFDVAQFDLIYSIGVLAEHTPLTRDVVALVARWLKPGGRFVFTAVRPDSPSVPQTFSRRLGESIAAAAPAPVARALRRRLLQDGLYADDQRIRELLTPGFAIESLDAFLSESHLHCLCVARRLVTEDRA
jgi:SAM-dependent methyltransferase